jgi:ferric-dicitrate binding protein FerR (iron transport regulator)
MEGTSQLCERARRWSSLRADDELSELESALLDAHLARCSACREFAQGANEIAVALRAAVLEPAPPLLETLPVGRRRSPLRGLPVAAAVALIVAAGAVVGISSAPGRQPAAPKRVAMIAGFDSADQLRALRRPLLLEGSHAVTRNRLMPGESV